MAADRAHIRHDGADWQLIRKYNGQKGWMVLEDDRKTSPIVLGFVDGNDKIVAVEFETTDTSTGVDIVRTVTQTIEGGAVGVYDVTDRVLRAENIRDMTAQEIIDRGTDTVNGNYQRLDDDELLDANRNILFRHHNSIRVLDEAVALLAAAMVPPLDLTPADDKKWLKVEFNDYYKARIQDAVDNA
ncbi:MAG: hypothetical protein GY807_21105 [Gammaproteobacteria bacterium]|nr:hypothetical protein [Gammaproteobacteria bacterium]